MKKISREELKQKIENEDELKLVEVLGPKYYKKFHLPGAINVPIEEGFEEAIQTAVPDKTDPVVVYCYDKDCSASPKAARAMEELGYENVFDYEAGKTDWNDAGLPIETSIK
jgi:rhodanese-related sulfurtransferase